MTLRKCIPWLVGFGILFPLFFQISGEIYRDVFPMTDSLGNLSKLPLPLSLPTCVLAIAFFASRWRRAQTAFVMICGVTFVGLISIWLSSDGITHLQRKSLMLAQVLLPLIGLLLGQILDDSRKMVARAFLVVVSIVVPLQLLSTWFQGGVTLSHYVYAFSIYSHLQYVALIVVCAYAFALTSLWDENPIWLCFLALPLAIYLAASLSFLTIFAFVVLLVVFSSGKLWQYRKNFKLVLFALLFIAATVSSGLHYYSNVEGKSTLAEGQGSLYSGKFKVLAAGKLPVNVTERFGDWVLFGRAVIENKTTLLVGHAEPMPREIRSSAHNFYIDIAYTFGLLGLLPIAFLISYTFYLCWQLRKNLNGSTWWLIAIVAYLVFVDSNFKVTLRQPYPGIFAYFLWGLLLTRLQTVLPDKQSS